MRLCWSWNACERMAGYREDALLPVANESSPVRNWPRMSEIESEACDPPPPPARHHLFFTHRRQLLTVLYDDLCL